VWGGKSGRLTRTEEESLAAPALNGGGKKNTMESFPGGVSSNQNACYCKNVRQSVVGEALTVGREKKKALFITRKGQKGGQV